MVRIRRAPPGRPGLRARRARRGGARRGVRPARDVVPLPGRDRADLRPLPAAGGDQHRAPRPRVAPGERGRRLHVDARAHATATRCSPRRGPRSSTCRSSTSSRRRRAVQPPKPGAPARRVTAPLDLLEREQIVATPLDEAFTFFGDPLNLEAITPPWLNFRIIEAPAALARGSILRYRLRLACVPVSWQTEIAAWIRRTASSTCGPTGRTTCGRAPHILEAVDNRSTLIPRPGRATACRFALPGFRCASRSARSSTTGAR